MVSITTRYHGQLGFHARRSFLDLDGGIELIRDTAYQDCKYVLLDLETTRPVIVTDESF